MQPNLFIHSAIDKNDSLSIIRFNKHNQSVVFAPISRSATVTTLPPDSILLNNILKQCPSMLAAYAAVLCMSIPVHKPSRPREPQTPTSVPTTINGVPITPLTIDANNQAPHSTNLKSATTSSESVDKSTASVPRKDTQTSVASLPKTSCITSTSPTKKRHQSRSTDTHPPTSHLFEGNTEPITQPNHSSLGSDVEQDDSTCSNESLDDDDVTPIHAFETF